MRSTLPPTAHRENINMREKSPTLLPLWNLDHRDPPRAAARARAVPVAKGFFEDRIVRVPVAVVHEIGPLHRETLEMQHVELRLVEPE